ncbi:MAG: tetratricopeptide repeat protein [Deltaproteobacteria bacterium]|nr:tetratricopeptide repeat protein [Deltaproteobacteria bacterium]
MNFETLLKDGKFDEAELLCLKQLQETPGDYELLIRLGVCRQLKGDVKGSAGVLGQLSENNIRDDKNRKIYRSLSAWVKNAAACGVVIGIAVTGCTGNTEKNSQETSPAAMKSDDAPSLPVMGPVKEPVKKDNSDPMEPEENADTSDMATVPVKDDTPRMKYGVRPKMRYGGRIP